MVKKNLTLMIWAVWLLVFIFWSSSSFAVQLNNTRVVVPGATDFGTVVVKNPSSEPFVVQSWIEGPNGEMETPFFVTPPLLRMDAKEEFLLNIMKVAGGLPEDRESYFWLNVLEIPRENENNTNVLMFAVKTRIKVFYRPEGIGYPEAVENYLEWTLSDPNHCILTLNNISAFIINFSAININDELLESSKGFMAMPFSAQSIELPSCSGALRIDATVINDYGALVRLSPVPIR